jgi:hypothetical protein
VASPYLQSTEKPDNLDLEGFYSFIKESRKRLKSLDDFRNLLIISSRDSQEVSEYKLLFQKIAIIFMKYFSVNWIFAGRVEAKMAYLKIRGNLLRRLKNPEFFVSVYD